MFLRLKLCEKTRIVGGKANVEKNPPKFDFLQRKPKKAIKKLIIVRSHGWEVGHGMTLLLLRVLFSCSSADLSHGMDSLLLFVLCKVFFGSHLWSVKYVE